MARPLVDPFHMVTMTDSRPIGELLPQAAPRKPSYKNAEAWTAWVKFRGELRANLARRDGPVCTYCGIYLAKGYRTLDHVIPYRLVQHWEPWNLVLACERCNTAKDTGIPAFLVPLLAALVHQRLALMQSPTEHALVPYRPAALPSLVNPQPKERGRS